MSLAKCRECGAQVSSTAKACPKCGAKPQKKRWRIFALLGGFLIIALMVSGRNEQPSSQPSPARAKDPEAQRVAKLTPQERKAEEVAKAAQKAAADKAKRLRNAAMACEMFVKRNLHDSDSGEFDDFDRYPVQELESGVFAVQVSFRARNAFNALRAGVVNCQVQRDSKGNWALVGLREVQ